jgi:hypothetical protein
MAWTAGTTFESRSTGTTSAIGTAAATVGTSTSTIRASSAAAVSSAAAERALEARARITADARGVPWEVLAGSAGRTAARGTGFAWKQNDIVLDDGRSGDGFAGGGRNHFLFDVFDFEVLVFGMFVFGVSMLVVFVMLSFSVLRMIVFKLGMLMLDVHGLAQGCGVFGAFLRDVRGELCTVGGTACFDFLGFFRGELRYLSGFRGRCFFRFVRLFFVLILFEFGTADDGIGFRFFLRLFVFCFHETGSERGDLILI